ncbi:MAG: DeoR family transcriptional regulator, partial [Methanobrevibacter sp.]|nr:DeoR family transcriptional regulator [Methanobrevibacter sp.]
QKQFLRMNDVGEITIKEYMEIFSVVRNTATKDLNDLVDMKIVDKIKDGVRFIYRRID